MCYSVTADKVMYLTVAFSYILQIVIRCYPVGRKGSGVTKIFVTRYSPVLMLLLRKRKPFLVGNIALYGNKTTMINQIQYTINPLVICMRTYFYIVTENVYVKYAEVPDGT